MAGMTLYFSYIFPFNLTKQPEFSYVCKQTTETTRFITSDIVFVSLR